MNSSPKVQTQDTTQTRKPLGSQLPTWLDIWGKTGHALDQAKPTDFWAGPNQMQQNANDALFQSAGRMGTAAPDLAAMAKKIASGFFLDPNNDPTFQGAADAAIRPLTTQLQQNILPGLIDKSMRTGGVGSGPAAYGGARQDLQQERAVGDWEVNAGDITGELANKSRTAGMALLPQAAGMAAAANQQFAAPAMTQALAGAQRQQWEQGGMDEAIKKYLFQFTGPQQAAGIMSQGGFGTQTGQTTQTSAAPDMMTQWLQGLSGGAAGLSSLFGAQGAMPGVGAAAGTAGMSALTSLLAMLSDRRTKEDIVQVGTSFSGKPIYCYKYKGLPGHMLGFMADEVDPEAVVERDGVLYVDYKKATEKDVSHGR